MPMANAGIHPTTGANMEYRGLISYDETLPTWDRADANEFGRLAQGVGGHIEGSNIVFTKLENVHHSKHSTYTVGIKTNTLLQTADRTNSTTNDDDKVNDDMT
jgi:hypothetical protein